MTGHHTPGTLCPADGQHHTAASAAKLNASQGPLPVPPWPDDGPAVEYNRPGAHHPVYRKPTLTNMTGERTGGRASVISDRAAQRIHFSYTVDGVHLSFEAIVTQDRLFQILNDAGVFATREI